MNILKKDILDILSEFSEIDDIEIMDFDEDELDEIMKKDNMEDISSIFDELPKNIFYNENMVNVIEFSKNKYLIENDNLLKYIENKNCNVETAIKNICEYNNIDYDKTYLLIESSNSIRDSLLEANEIIKKSKNKSIKDKVKDQSKKSIKYLKYLKDKKIKVITKPNK